MIDLAGAMADERADRPWRWAHRSRGGVSAASQRTGSIFRPASILIRLPCRTSREAWHRLPDRHLVDAARNAAAATIIGSRRYPAASRSRHAVGHPASAASGRPRPPRRHFRRRPMANMRVCFRARRLCCRSRYPSVDQLTPDHGLAVVVNPNNPTGRTFPPDEIAALARADEGAGGMLLVDEAFGDMRAGFECRCPCWPTRQLDRLPLLRQILRPGWPAARFRRCRRSGARRTFREWLGPWAVSGPALVIAAATDERRYAMPCSPPSPSGRPALERVLDGAGLTIVGGTAAFTLVEASAGCAPARTSVPGAHPDAKIRLCAVAG